MSHSRWDLLSPEEAKHLDQICDQFEEALQQEEKPSLEEYCSKVEERFRRALFRELLYLECEHRQGAGMPLRVEDYQSRFPSEISVIREVIEDLSVTEEKAEPLSPSQVTTLIEVGTAPVDDTEAAQGAEDRPGERYELFEAIGEGGVGVVYRCRDRHLGRQAAIKILGQRHEGSTELRQRFQAEARLTSQLQHPSIVPVYDMGRLPDHRPYFAMKLVEGRALQELLRERKDPSERLSWFLSIFEQICQAVAYAHSLGVIHRDLKPQNVMVGAFGEVQVMDWGFAKVLDSGSSHGTVEEESGGEPFSLVGEAELSREGMVLGTLAYIPPEQAMGRPQDVNQAADVFGLGAILCATLTGAPPYQGATILDLLEKAKGGELSDAFARIDAADADQAVKELAKKCLSPNSEDRPTDAGEVADAISHYRAGVEEQLRQATLDRAVAEGREKETRAKLKAEQKALRYSIALGMAIVLGLCALIVGGYFYQQNLKQANADIREQEKIARDQRDVATEALEGSRRSAYNLRLAFVGALWKPNPRYALELLEDEEACPEKLRDFTWGYYYRLCKRYRRTISFRSKNERIIENVKHLSHSADGSLLAIAIHELLPKPGSMGFTYQPVGLKIALWDLLEEKEIERIAVPGVAISSMVMSPDGSKVAFANSSHFASVWSVGEKKELMRLEDSTGRIRNVAISPDGKYLATGAHQLKIFDLETGKERMAMLAHWTRAIPAAKQAEVLAKYYRPQHSTIGSVLFSPDSKTIVSQSSGIQVTGFYPMCLWDVESGELREWQEKGALKKSLSCAGFAFSPNGRILATAEKEGVCLRDARSMAILSTFTGRNGTVLRWSPDGKRLAVMSKARAWILDVETGNELEQLEPDTQFSGVVWPLSSQTLISRGPMVSNGKDIIGGQVAFWDVGRKPWARALADRHDLGFFTFSPDSNLVVSQNATVWNVRSGEKVRAIRRNESLVNVFLPNDGTILYCAQRYTGEVCRYDLENRKWLDKVIKPTLARTVTKLLVKSGAFTSNGSRLFLVFNQKKDQWLRSQDVKSREMLWEKKIGPSRPIDPRTGKQVMFAQSAHLALSPNGEVLAVADRWSVRLFETRNGNESDSIKIDFRSRLNPGRMPFGLAWSPDNRTLAVSGDGAIQLWRTDLLKPLRMLEEPQYLGTSVPMAFSPDGKTLASGGLRNKIFLWDPQSGQLRAAIEGHQGPLRCLRFSPDGQYLASGGGKWIYLWEAPVSRAR